MPKNPSFNWDNCKGVLAQKAKTTGWALCVGAGTSIGPFPSWETLVRKLIKRDARVKDATALLEQLNQSFSYDALIEAAKDVLEMDDDAFSAVLQRSLYSKLKKDAGHSWDVVVKALTAASPAQLQRSQWQEFYRFIRKAYPDLSALKIAASIVDVARSPSAPSAILTFNAEPLLYALIHALQAMNAPAGADLKGSRLLDRVTRAISYREQGRLPFIFCHGLMPLDGGFEVFPKIASPEKLVFSEGAYLQLANSSFSWQASLFLGTVVLRSTVFIGLSFSDPNLRRWLAWVHANQTSELALKSASASTNSYGHYWIEKDPSDPVKRAWIESSVRHLGRSEE